MRSISSILVLLAFIIKVNLCATHIVGGELNYTYIGNNTYRIQLQLYIDCYNGDPGAINSDRFAQIAVFSKATGQLVPNLSLNVERNTPVRVSKTNYNCIKIAPNACVDAYTYDTVITLPPLKEGYILSFQRCCRNHSILNLSDPGSTGANFWTHINPIDSVGENSNPYFKNLPPNFLCTNTELVFDHSATDADGDSLVYEFFQPYLGGTYTNPRPSVTQYETPPFTKVSYIAGYSPNQAINSLPTVFINRQTGQLKITPTLPGQFVVGIVVKEYRDGKLIGFTQRDFQFNVANCVFETVSAFVAPDINCDREVKFNNNSQNATSYFWDFGDSTATNDTSNQQSGFYSYPKVGKYKVMLVAATGNCADTQFKEIEIFERLIFKLPNDTLICPGSSVNLFPDTTFKGASLLWSTNVTDSFITRGNPGQYWLRMELGNCDGYDTANIFLDSSNVFMEFDDIYCDEVDKEYKGKVFAKGDFKTLNWSSNPSIMPNNYKDSVFDFNQSAEFTIFGLTKNGCAYSEKLDVKKQSQPKDEVRLYNTFTPNKDGYNDVFPEAKPNYLYELTVYNRWGVKIYEAKNKPWLGTDLTSGTYYYTMKLKSCNSEEEVVGVVTLVK